MFVIERSDEGKKISTGRYKPDSIKIQEHIASQNLLVYRNMVCWSKGHNDTLMVKN